MTPRTDSAVRSMVAQTEAELNRELRISQSSRKLALLANHLAVLLSSGVPLIKCLEALQVQSQDANLSLALETISKQVQSGHRLSVALRQFSGIFPPVFTGLIAVGENTGSLVEAIRHLSIVLEKEYQLKVKVTSVLAYPTFILALTGGLTIVMFRYVLPTFVELFSGNGAELPLPTRFVLLTTKLVGSPWFWLISLALLFALVRQVREMWTVPEQRLLLYRGIEALPGIGNIMRFVNLTRFCWVMQLTLRTGLDYMKCLSLAAIASGSATIEADLPQALTSVSQGEKLSTHMRRHPEVWPSLLRHFVQLGEVTELSKVFGYAASWFEEEVDARVEAFKAALEPILMVGVAMIVGGIVLSIFLPLYGLLDKL